MSVTPFLPHSRADREQEPTTQARAYSWWKQLSAEHGWLGRRLHDIRMAPTYGWRLMAGWIKTVIIIDDLVRTYRGFLDRRRADRPQEEYREPTEQEWRDFQQHFELRKVSLGTCGRPYGTPCKHEHACIRCPVLQIDPRQRPRLIEIIQNLRERIREARGNGWLGEVEGLQVSLDAATAKLNSLSQAPADGRPQLVDLGMPVFTDDAPPSTREHGARA